MDMDARPGNQQSDSNRGRGTGLPAGHRLSGRVLVVDDNRVHRMIATIMMQGWGIEVVQAFDGLEAVRRVTQCPSADLPNLVLMDLRMPVMDGYAATEHIRAWEKSASGPDQGLRLPIIALTADAFEQDRQRCLSVGMDSFVTKPINKKMMYTALADWLPSEASTPLVAQKPSFSR